MNKKRGIGIGIIFSVTSFVVMMLSLLLVGVTIYVRVRIVTPGFGGGPRPLLPMTPLALFMLISALIGIAMSLVVSKIILKPILRISEATKQVAKGDFTVSLNEKYHVTELSEISGNFNLMVRELAGIETLRTDFIVNVSHEFKTPIAAIEGYATLLQDPELPEDERLAYARVIADSAGQLSTLSGNILRLSKLENQGIIADRELYRLDEQLRQAILLLEPLWTEKCLSLDVELQKLEYNGNSELMFHVWTNIIGNAVKFTPKNGEVSVRLTGDDKAVTAVIADSGPGMTQEVQRRVFDRFYQADTARAESGNGLGLALAKRVVDLCGGSIEIKSAPGEGAAFTVTLPGV